MLHVSDNLSNYVPLSCLRIISDPLRVRCEVGMRWWHNFSLQLQ